MKDTIITNSSTTTAVAESILSSILEMRDLHAEIDQLRAQTEAMVAALLRAHAHRIDDDGGLTRENQTTDVLYIGPGFRFVAAPDGVGRYWYDSDGEAVAQHGQLPVVWLEEEPTD